MDIVLASASPRRKELLAQLGVIPKIEVADIDETAYENEDPVTYVRRLALSKAKAVAAQHSEDTLVLGSDTIVTIDDVLMGKPENQEHAADMLRKLSGRVHQVVTAVCGQQGDTSTVVVSETKVHFCPLNDTDIEAYWQTQEPLGKAGGYAIQGIGAQFIERIEGSYSGVMGLPLYETAQLLKQWDVPLMPRHLNPA